PSHHGHSGYGHRGHGHGSVIIAPAPPVVVAPAPVVVVPAPVYVEPPPQVYVPPETVYVAPAPLVRATPVVATTPAPRTVWADLRLDGQGFKDGGSAGGRLRLEAGVGVAFAPDMTATGPQLGVSGELRIIGPLGVEGAARVVPWPHRTLDWHAALQLSVGPVDLRAGVRQLYLDDAGLVDGVRHTDSFLGPWLGFGIRL
ncbi:MAG: hypothetical protein HY901_14425, partial [Deltaproteobacteria bacterium]|nr:hypothetical protein [Deltaproteobacteria bacterium]